MGGGELPHDEAANHCTKLMDAWDVDTWERSSKQPLESHVEFRNTPIDGDGPGPR